ncbi:MAG: hypothetical protein NWP98_07885 [Erythrobacter sp.]|nr:hypothetical protein [Erythrobacter sp.]
MDWWLPVFGLVFLLVCVVFLGWLVWQHANRGWKDHLWIWDEANDRALLFAITFSVLVGAEWLRFGWTDKAIVYVWAGIVFVALPYFAYITGRLLGIWHRARQRRTLH